MYAYIYEVFVKFCCVLHSFLDLLYRGQSNLFKQVFKAITFIMISSALKEGTNFQKVMQVNQKQNVANKIKEEIIYSTLNKRG